MGRMGDGRHINVEIDVILVAMEEGMGGGCGFVGGEGGCEDGGGGSSGSSDVHGPPIYLR